jgi:hypothetical protein
LEADRRQNLRRQADRLQHRCLLADWLRVGSRPGDSPDAHFPAGSADGLRAGLALTDRLQAGLASADERPAWDPERASRAIRQDRPNPGRDASESRTDTSPDPASR